MSATGNSYIKAMKSFIATYSITCFCFFCNSLFGRVKISWQAAMASKKVAAGRILKMIDPFSEVQ